MTDASFHEEGLARIHLPKAVTEGTQTKAVFLNPVQHYNRDLSVVAIRTFSEMLASEKLAAWGKKLENRKAKKARKAIFKDEQGSANKRHKGLNGDVTVETTASVRSRRMTIFGVEVISTLRKKFIQRRRRHTHTRLTNSIN